MSRWKIILLGIIIFGYGAYSYVSVVIQTTQTSESTLEFMENTQFQAIVISFVLMAIGGGVIVLGLLRKKPVAY